MKKLLTMCFLIFGNYLITTAQTILKPQMVAIEGGTFIMGSNSSDADSDEKPTHTITISSFSIGKYEVTVAEFKAFSKATGYSIPDLWDLLCSEDKCVMTNVNFNDVNAYCNWLKKSTGQNYRLPTEAEWEFAARGGKKSLDYVYSGSDDFDEVGGEGGQAVGRKKPNELGLYDMSNNAWEWCSDWYSESYYSNSPSANPHGPSSGSKRVIRGGNITETEARVSNRDNSSPDERDYSTGFRLVLTQ